MRNKGLVTAAVLLVLGFVPLAGQEGDAQYYAESYARLSYVRGDVYVQRTSDLGYEKGEVNLAIVQGDKLGTRDGQAEIALGRRNFLRLDTDSQVEFALMPRQEGDLLKVSLLAGSAYFRVASLSGDKKIELHTPDASYYFLDEGLYRFDVRDGAETEVFVVSGELEAAGEEGSSVVGRSERLVAADGAFQGEPEYGGAVSDDFERWNASRDELLTARRSTSSGTRYLPTNLDEYEDELADSGRWTYEQPYGYVWVPRVAYDDWRPYYYGRWVWYPIIGWTWVSSEPWGWCTYHYGRWHWRNSLGWYWIPTRHWGPAWVHWHWDSHHVGWSPLSWHNRPGVIMHGRYYDRYGDRDFPYDNRAMTMVRRSDLQERNIGRVSLRGDALRGVGRVSLRAEQPDLRPIADRTSPEALTAKRLFSQAPRPVGERSLEGGRIRSFSRDAGSGGAAAPLNSSRLSSERLRSGGFRSAPAERSDTNAQGGTVYRRSTASRDRDGASTDRSVSRSGGLRADPNVRVYPSRRSEGSAAGTARQPGFRSSGAGERQEINKSSSGRSASGIRTYPSRGSVSRSSSGESRSFSSSNDRRAIRDYSSRIRSGASGSESGSPRARTYESRPSIRSSNREGSSWSGLGSILRGRESSSRASDPEVRESYSRSYSGSDSPSVYSGSRAPSPRSFSSPRSSSPSRSSDPSASSRSSSRSSVSRSSSSSSRSSSPSRGSSSSSSGRVHRKG